MEVEDDDVDEEFLGFYFDFQLMFCGSSKFGDYFDFVFIF